MKLYITRHGTTEWNLEKRLQGWGDSPLTRDGKSRAVKLGISLANTDLDIIYTSPLNRALETAKLIKGNRDIEIKTHDDLKELGHGLWEGLFIGDIKREYEAEYFSYRNTPETYVSINGESFTDLFQRVKSFLEEIKTKDYQNVLIVSHGITIKAMLAIIKDSTWEEFSNLEVYTGTALNICQLKDDKFELLVEGDTSHL